MAHLVLSFITMGYLWQEGEEGTVKVTAGSPARKELAHALLPWDCGRASFPRPELGRNLSRALCPPGPAPPPRRPLLGGVAGPRAPPHPQPCRLCLGQLEEEGPQRVNSERGSCGRVSGNECSASADQNLLNPA